MSGCEGREKDEGIVWGRGSERRDCLRGKERRGGDCLVGEKERQIEKRWGKDKCVREGLGVRDGQIDI